MLPKSSARTLLVPLFRLSILGAVIHAGVGVAQQSGADQRIAFDIPAQPLEDALTQYFRLTGVQLLYDSTLAAGIRSTAVQGVHTRREALRLLLSGTGLVVRYSRASAAIITKPEASAASPLVPLGRIVVRERIAAPRLSPAERLGYFDQIETELKGLLRNDRRTARLVFNVVVELRVGDDGKLSEIRFDRGTGDRRIEQLLVETLETATVSPPPQGLDQPLLVALKGASR